MRRTLLTAMLFLAGCDVPGISACEQALKSQLNDPNSYKQEKIKEEFGQGKSTSTYIITYHVKNNLNEYTSYSAVCTYGNESRKVYIRNMGSLN